MHLPHVLVNDLEREVLFVLEVMVERTLRSTRGFEQSLDAQIVVPMLQQHGHPRIEQALLGDVLGVQWGIKNPGSESRGDSPLS